jgi:hypothetical protein
MSDQTLPMPDGLASIEADGRAAGRRTLHVAELLRLS